MAALDHMTSGSEGSDDDVQPVRLPGDLVPRPVWTGLTIMPRIQGLATAAIDTKRARLCTASNLHIKDGRQSGGEIALWSLRSTEMILSHKIPVPADGGVKNTIHLFYLPHAKSFIGVAASSFVWAVDEITLQCNGEVQAHDRQCLAATVNRRRHELYCMFADGLVKVFTLSSAIVRDNVKMRNVSKTSFGELKDRAWQSRVWVSAADLDEQQDLLIAAAETGVYCWNVLTGALLSKFEQAHGSKVCSVHSYSVRGEGRCATGDLEGHVRIWALKDSGLKKYLYLEAHKGAQVGSICFEASQGTLLTFAPSTPSIRSWTPETGSMTGDLICYPNDFAPDPTSRMPEDIKMAKAFSTRVAAGEQDPSSFLAQTPCQLSQHLPTAKDSQGKRVRSSPLLMLIQGTLVRVYRLSSDCAFLAAASGLVRDMRVIHLPPPLSGSGAGDARGKGGDRIEGGEKFGKVSEVAVCLSAEGVLESFNCVDGVLHSVLEPSVARHIAGVARSGGAAPAAAAKKKKRRRKKVEEAEGKQMMSVVEKRSMMAKKIIEQVAKKKVEAEMGASAYAATRKRQRILAKGRSLDISAQQAKTYFTSAPSAFQAVGWNTSMAAVLWPDSTIDVVDVISGACISSYSAVSDKKGKGGGGGGAAAAEGGGGARVSAFVFADKVGAGDAAAGAGGGGTGAKVSPRKNAEEDAEDDTLHLVSGYENGMIKVWGKWSAPEPGEMRSVKVAEGVQVKALHYIRDGGLLIVISGSIGMVQPLVAVWKLEFLNLGAKSTSSLPHSECLSSVQFQIEPASQEVVVIGYESGLVQVWAVDKDDMCTVLVDNLEGHAAGVRSVRPSPDGTRLLSLSTIHEVMEWDVLRGVCLRTLSFNFLVENADYAAEYTVVVSSKQDLRRIPAASLAVALPQADGAVGVEEEEEEMSEEAAAELERQAKLDRLMDLSTRYGLEFWQSVAAKTFAQGYYGSTDFLGPEYQVSGVRNTSFVPKVDPRGLPLRPLYLFSRHNGLLMKKMANPFNTTKIINVGDEHWSDNRQYVHAGGSQKVAAQIQEMAARLRQEEADAEAEAEVEAAAAAAASGAAAQEAKATTDLSKSPPLAVGVGPPVASRKGGPLPTLEAIGEEAAGHGKRSTQEEAKRSTQEEAGQEAGMLTFRVPKASESALLTKALRNKARRAHAGDPREGEVEDEGEEEDPLEHNQQQIYLMKHTPIWLHSKHKVPEYVVNGGMGVRPVAHKVEMDPDDEWGSMPQPYVRRHVAEVQPWVMPELKKALSKQGLKAQFLNTQPEEWDPPEVADMLTRVRVSELRRPSSAASRLLPIPDEAGEKYRFGVSNVVDEILGAHDKDPNGVRGRSISVPLVDRPYWQSNEVPHVVAGVDISLDATAGTKGLGAHLPPSMSRLSDMAVVTQQPNLAGPGANGLLHHDPPSFYFFEGPEGTLQVDPPLSRAGGGEGDGDERAPTAGHLRQSTPHLYPTRNPPHSPLPDLQRAESSGRHLSDTLGRERSLERSVAHGGNGNARSVSPLSHQHSATRTAGSTAARPGGTAEREARADSITGLLRAATADRGGGGGGKGGGEAHLGEMEAVSLIMQGLRVKQSHMAEKRRLLARGAGLVLSKGIQECVPPEDDWSLYVANGELLPFFPCVRNLTPCDASNAEGDCTCFFAEVRLAGGDSVWERVVLKEAPPPGRGIAQAMIDSMKPLFGINCMDARRVRLNACIRRKDPSFRAWVFADGTPNYEARQTTQTGGTCFLVFRDYAHARPCVSLRRLEGTVRKGKVRAGGGPLYTSPELLTDFLIVSAFRLIFESDVSFDLDSLLVLPGGAVLPICETAVLERKYPARGDLEGASGSALKQALAPLLPEVEERIETWWEEVSLGKVWDVLALFGYGSSHLKRLVRNMRHLIPTLRAMLRPGPFLPGSIALSSEALNPLPPLGALGDSREAKQVYALDSERLRTGTGTSRPSTRGSAFSISSVLENKSSLQKEKELQHTSADPMGIQASDDEILARSFDMVLKSSASSRGASSLMHQLTADTGVSASRPNSRQSVRALVDVQGGKPRTGTASSQKSRSGSARSGMSGREGSRPASVRTQPQNILESPEGGPWSFDSPQRHA